MTPPIHTISDVTLAASAFEAAHLATPVAVVLPACSRFAATRPSHLCGLAVAFDAGLLPHQALFFSEQHHFTRYSSQIPSV
jgi:hypothetical protein